MTEALDFLDKLDETREGALPGPIRRLVRAFRKLREAEDD